MNGAWVWFIAGFLFSYLFDYLLDILDIDSWEDEEDEKYETREQNKKTQQKK